MLYCNYVYIVLELYAKDENKITNRRYMIAGRGRDETRQNTRTVCDRHESAYRAVDNRPDRRRDHTDLSALCSLSAYTHIHTYIYCCICTRITVTVTILGIMF